MYGAIYSGIDVRDYRMVCAASEQDFPAEFELKTCRVKNQLSTGSCVAHALSSIVEFYNRKQNDADVEMSTGYIYGNRTNSAHKGPGMVIRDALDIVRKFGDVPRYEFPYNVETPEAIKLYRRKSQELYDIGYPHRISEYCRISTASAAKTALMAGVPLLMAMDWYTDMDVVDGVLTSNYVGNEGGHCMFIYGWDERGWKIQNSWGEDWGVNGKFILPYDMPMAECWAVMDDIIEGAHIEKPFSSKAGNVFAKIINKVCNIFNKAGD